MLIQFLIDNRAELIERCQTKVALRLLPITTNVAMDSGVPQFLDQVIRTLQQEHAGKRSEGDRISGPSGGRPVPSEVGFSAKQHARALLARGFTVDQVVHDYGDLCQAVTDAAVENEIKITVEDFRIFNRCLDNAVAEAVTEFAYQKSLGLNERLGTLAHEVRNRVHAATLAVQVIKSGKVGLGGATGGVLDRSLSGITQLIDAAVGEVRVVAGMAPNHETTSVAEFLSEVEQTAVLDANQRGCPLVVGRVDPTLAISVDRSMLLGAVINLLQNAFKFSRHSLPVTLNAYAMGDRVRIDVEDSCGGLPAGFAETMFEPFTQGASDKTGLGLGLSISRRGIEANHGLLTVRDMPGRGCVFTVDLPRHALPAGAGIETAS